MHVETYEATEVMSTCEPQDQIEVARLVDSLHLTEQQKFLSPTSPTTVPYRKMTAQEQHVYRVLCPVTTVLTEYGEMLMPLRILQVAAHAISLGFFERIEVWHIKNGDQRIDPVLVGITKESSYREGVYLLARWGEVLKPFAELIVEAKVAITNQLVSKLTLMEQKIKARIASVEAIAAGYVQGEEISIAPTYYD